MELPPSPVPRIGTSPPPEEGVAAAGSSEQAKTALQLAAAAAERAEAPGPSPFVPPDTLVLSGGGPDGIAFLGCVRWLERAKALGQLRTVVGCSAGAIVAFLLALRMTSDDMRAFALRGLEDGSLRDLDVEGIVSFAERLGVDDGSRVVDALRRELRTRVRGAPEDATFLELAKATGRNLVVCVANLEESRSELLSVDTTPDLSVLTAVRMSFSVPLVLTPVRWRGRTYVDGCLFDFCPTAHILSSGTATSTLAFRITTEGFATKRQGSDTCDGEGSDAPPGIVNYLGLLARAVMTRSCGSSQGHKHGTGTGNGTALLRTVDVPGLLSWGDDGATACRFDVYSLSLCISAEGLDRYVQHGFNETERQIIGEGRPLP